LHIPQSDTGVEGGGDECMPQGDYIVAAYLAGAAR